MRWVRVVLLAAMVGGSSWLLAGAVLDPLVEGWRVLEADAGRAEARSPADDLAALLAAGCATLVVAAWSWVAVTIGVCTWDSLRAECGRTPGTPAPTTGSLLRPRLVRALVATCVGAGGVTVPAMAVPGPSAAPVDVLPRDLAGAWPTTTAGHRVLEGLPVPDRAVGRLSDRSDHRRPDRPGRREIDRPRPGTTERGTRLVVRPGDSLWTLTAGLLPRGASVDLIDDGWRLLYRANRSVVGSDPDLLRPGQSLVVDPALTDFVDAVRAVGRSGRPCSTG